MNNFMETNKKIEKAVVSGYKKIEKGVVGSYKAVEETVVDGYKKIENKFVAAFLTPDEDSPKEEGGSDIRSQPPERGEDNE